MRRTATALLLGLLLPTVALAAAPAKLRVTVRGAVTHAGTVAVPAGARLADVALAAGVRADAYPLGADWQVPSRVPAQRALKAGLVFDLRVLADAARLRGDTALHALAARWLTRLTAMPVTGRRPGLVLDPRRLELAHVNPLLEDGATLHYPTRPHTVRVVGALRAPCTRAFVPMQAAVDYLHGCARAAGASPDWLYVIEPDGHVTRRGTGPWNRQASIPVAPGALLFVPLDTDVLKIMRDSHFNADMARFLATQPLAGDGR
jgi:hypothetical protein